MRLLFERISSQLYAARHKAYVRSLSGLAPYYVVNEFPKSGGTWLAQMLADVLCLPFRRNKPIRFERSITHGHFLSPVGMRNIVVLWRDPRDILVSFYYHCYFVNEHKNALLVRLMKQQLPFVDYQDVRSNMPIFIRFMAKSPISPRFAWPDFVRIWAGMTGTVQTSYEALRADTTGKLVWIAGALTGEAISTERAADVVEKYSFDRVKRAAESNRPGSAEISFVREGALGGWQKHFTPEAMAALRDCGYEEGIRALGYETMAVTVGGK